MSKRANPKPKHLGKKLLAIRHHLGLSQFQMAQRLGFPSYAAYYHRISEFERGRRLPHVLALLAYARAASVPMESLVDDETELPL